MPYDIIAIGAHPDDVEVGTGGVLIRLAQRGRKTGIVYLTAGEMGTGGDADIRGRDPVETLELLTLCPEYRATPQVRHPPKHAGASGKPLELPCESVVETLTISTELIRKIMSQHFRTLLQHPN